VPTDYFVCPDEVKKVFGAKPTELRVMFPTEDEQQWSSQFLKYYSATQELICRGDGVFALAKLDIHTGEIAGKESKATELREITCNPAKCLYYQKARCRRVMNLQFILPDCPGFGVYQLDTSSFNSIVNVNSCLDLIHAVCGRLSMIPLSLKLVGKDVLPEGKLKIARVLELTPPYSLIQAQKYAQIPPWKILLLPAPDSEAPDDLFPEQALKDEDAPEKTPPVEKELVNIWDKVKSKVWHMEIQDAQIALWFRRNYRMDVCLADFNRLTPPANVTAEHLEHFLKAIEQYSNQI
jgi:hypothetical protein